MTRFIFITEGVVSSLGMSITSASLGAILESRGLTIRLVKLDRLYSFAHDAKELDELVSG